MKAPPAAAARGASAPTSPLTWPLDWCTRLREIIVAHPADAAIVVGVTLLAGALRLWDLGGIPNGLHGDEAWTGLDAQRILDEGWIGVYVRSALGQPSGPLYVAAIFFAVLPDETWTIRLSMAVFGVATIPLAYAAFALWFDRVVAAFAAFILATMTWHLHMARTGFMVTTWPFMEMLVLVALWFALRRRTLPLFALTGLLLGLGVYTYNAWPLFAPVPIAAIAVAAMRERGGPERRRLAGGGALMLGVAVIVAVPLIVYAINNEFAYREHHYVVALTEQPQWKDAGFGDRVDLMRDRAWEWGHGLFFGDRPDLGDGLATDGDPVVDPAILALAVAGLAFAARDWRRPAAAMMIAAALALPFGAILTVQDGLFRRTLGLAPFVAVLAALPLAWLWRALLAPRSRASIAAAAVLLLIPGVAGARSVYQYFGPVQDEEPMRFVYPYQMDAAARHLDGLPRDTFVYWYSDRWPFGYETRRFLAPGLEGEDRSKEFRPGGFPEEPVVLARDHADRPVVWVLLDGYTGLAATLAAAYPGGTMTTAMRDGEVLFHAYALPAVEGAPASVQPP